MRKATVTLAEMVFAIASTPSGTTHADQDEADAALAGQIFEQERKARETVRTAREIVEWATERARPAVRNSPTGQAQQVAWVRAMLQCELKAPLSNQPDERQQEWHMERCVESAQRLLEPDEGVVRELRAHFIRERLEEERERFEQELFEAIQRLFEDAGHDVVI